MLDCRGGAVVAIALTTAGALAAGCSHTSSTGDGATDVTIITSSQIQTPAGRFVLQGEILHKYYAAGASTSTLGFPVSNEEAGPDGGRYSKFQSGVIYWTPTTGAHIVSGPIRGAWEYDNGGAGGPLGYPTSDEHAIAGGSQQDFQHGTITYSGGQPNIQPHA